ncbi:MAG: hypothetical protein V1495_09600 [Pseudomonadota bacterium]
MKRRTWVTVTPIVATLLLAGEARATMMLELNTTQLTQQARTVQVGKVTSSWSSWDSGKRMIFTYVKLKVDQTIKGQPQSEVMFRMPGGRTGGIGMVVHGMASFHPGERALVFLQQDSDGAPSLVGMAQGKFQIYRSAVTGEDMAVFRAPKNLEFYTRGTRGAALHVVNTPTEKRVLLRDLIGEIQAAARTETP